LLKSAGLNANTIKTKMSQSVYYHPPADGF